MRDIIQQYADGEISAQQALRALCNEYGENADMIEPWEAQNKELRKAIEHIVSKEGTTEIKGFGRLSIVPSSTSGRYDTKALDNLVLRLMQVGEYDIAAQISECKKESTRDAYLKIERER